MCGNRDKSLDAIQFDVLASQKGAGLSRCVRARIIMNNDLCFLVRFSNFYVDFRQGLWCSTQNLSSYDPQVEQSPHYQFCRRNRQPFASKYFFHKQLLLDLACLRRPT